MSDELLARAEREATFYDKKANMWTTGVLLRDLAARVRELEAKCDSLLHDWRNACDLMNRAEAERDALRTVVTGIRGPCPTPKQWVDICCKAREVAAALGESK